MAKIKLTKNELKSQRDALKRFQRYLPTLQLKKQQLQMEIRKLDQDIKQKSEIENMERKNLKPWIKLFSESVDLEQYIEISSLDIIKGNIAGVNIPILKKIIFNDIIPNISLTPLWIDYGIDTLKQLITLRIERKILQKQYELLMDELRTTTQRVNLFEKVKIPEAKENIRIIRIFMGDQQTAAVARSKIAKGKN
ncbi:MAG: V-type ATP synthase subunit D [Verrucomicrobiota bacterium]|nr:V-type ATP synthase subunit D [Verrucomicrobiota bacterium]MEC8313796.1 V-type ATP synthase subunit D [Verrucomicrobiota bacterium]MEC8753554.1 V-type ATP synthase subunit D [Verrucomicrobiota bacterium]